MSQDNVELAGQVMDALARRDPSRLIALSDPEVEWHSFFALSREACIAAMTGPGRYRSGLSDAWEIGRAGVDDALGIGDVAVLVGRSHYRSKGSGVESASAAGWMLKFRNGKVLRFRAFREPAQALEAVGLAA